MSRSVVSVVPTLRSVDWVALSSEELVSSLVFCSVPVTVSCQTAPSLPLADSLTLPLRRMLEDWSCWFWRSLEEMVMP